MRRRKEREEGKGWKEKGGERKGWGVGGREGREGEDHTASISKPL